MKRLLFLLPMVLLAGVAMAQVTPPGTVIDESILDTALGQLTDAASSYGPEMLIDATRILTVCAMVYFLALLMQYSYGNDFRALTWVAMMGLVRIGILNTVLSHSLIWGQAIIDTGTEIGEDLSGLSATSLTPSGVWELGTHIIGDIWSARSFGMWFHIGGDILLMLTSLVALIVYAAAALYYLWILLEAAYVVMFGPIYIAFSGLEWTWPSLFSWGGEVLAVAFKIIAVSAMLAIGSSLAEDWAGDFDSSGTLINLHRQLWANTALVESVVFGVIVMGVPWVVSRLVRTSHGAGTSQIAEKGFASTWGIAAKAGTAAATVLGRPVGRTAVGAATKIPSTPQMNSRFGAQRYVQARLTGGKP